MRRSFAKWLSVPKGKTPSGILVPANPLAMALNVPSPPSPMTTSTLALGYLSRCQSQEMAPCGANFGEARAARAESFRNLTLHILATGLCGKVPAAALSRTIAFIASPLVI